MLSRDNPAMIDGVVLDVAVLELAHGGLVGFGVIIARQPVGCVVVCSRQGFGAKGFVFIEYMA